MRSYGTHEALARLTLGKTTWAWPRLRRYAAVLSVAVAVGYSFAGAVNAVSVLDDEADTNASIADLDRLYGRSSRYWGVIRDKSVVEEALATMPTGAAYRVVVGPQWQHTKRSRWTKSVEADFLRFYLLPRRLTDSPTAKWAFCLGCSLSTLGSDAQVLARGRDGMLFVRVGK